MLRSGLARWFLVLLVARAVCAHAPPTPVPAAPFRAQSNRLVDAKGEPFLLRGATMPMLEAAPSAVSLRVFRQRWNLNAVRLPVSIARWRRDGPAYLDAISAAATTAERESLVPVIAAVGDSALPDAAAVEFWRAAAVALRGSGAIFSLYRSPRATDWREWAAAMQPLVDAVRAAGAAQIVAAPGRDGVGFAGFGRDFFLRDTNVMYEVESAAATDAARDSAFGFLVNDVPVMAASWSGPCESMTPDGVLATLGYLDRRNVSWTTATGACRAVDDAVVLWMTGDAGGFGTIDASQIASAAGGFPGPIAPGEVLSLYGQGIGPETAVGPRVLDGRVAASAGEVQVFFDGVAAPILLAGYFQVNVQVPYEVAGRAKTAVRLVYREVASNEVELAVTAAAPSIFTNFAGGSEALALNEDGTLNGAATPAPRGSVVALFATGAGQTTPASVTGVPASGTSAALAASARVGGREAELVYAGAAPTLVGVAQFNVRVPVELGAGLQRAAVVVSVGGASSRAGVSIWVK